MRFQGRITDWKDERGFGFILPHGGGAKVFVHIGALRRGEPRPGGNELVTYELAAPDDKGARAKDVAYVERARSAPRGRREGKTGGSGRGTWSALVLFIVLGAYAWQQFSPQHTPPQDATDAPPVPSASTGKARGHPLVDVLTAPDDATSFKCEGKIYCSQMASCAEAKYYLKNCPGVKIDGDRNGIPCESQHCGNR